MTAAGDATGFRLDVVVQPRAKRNRVVGWHGRSLKVQVTAPPVDGAANAAVIELVATVMDLAKSKVRILLGETSRSKTVEIAAPAPYCMMRLQSCTGAFVDIQKGRA